MMNNEATKVFRATMFATLQTFIVEFGIPQEKLDAVDMEKLAGTIASLFIKEYEKDNSDWYSNSEE